MLMIRVTRPSRSAVGGTGLAEEVEVELVDVAVTDTVDADVGAHWAVPARKAHSTCNPVEIEVCILSNEGDVAGDVQML